MPMLDFSEYIAERIRQRVDDPELAEKLIPKDHDSGFNVSPSKPDTETYNRDNVTLSTLEPPLSESPNLASKRVINTMNSTSLFMPPASTHLPALSTGSTFVELTASP